MHALQNLCVSVCLCVRRSIHLCCNNPTHTPTQPFPLAHAAAAGGGGEAAGGDDAMSAMLAQYYGLAMDTAGGFSAKDEIDSAEFDVESYARRLLEDEVRGAWVGLDVGG